MKINVVTNLVTRENEYENGFWHQRPNSEVKKRRKLFSLANQSSLFDDDNNDNQIDVNESREEYIRKQPNAVYLNCLYNQFYFFI